MEKRNKGMKGIKEIQKKASLAFIPTFPLARIYLPTHLAVLYTNIP